MNKIYVCAHPFERTWAKIIFPLLGNEKAPNGGEHVFFVIDDMLYEWVNPGRLVMEKMPPNWRDYITDIYSFECTDEEKSNIIQTLYEIHFSDVRYVKLMDYLKLFWKIPKGRAERDTWRYNAECVAVTREVLRRHFQLEDTMPVLWSLKTAFLFEDFKSHLLRIK